jgi:hypothetical protein
VSAAARHQPGYTKGFPADIYLATTRRNDRKIAGTQGYDAEAAVNWKPATVYTSWPRAISTLGDECRWLSEEAITRSVGYESAVFARRHELVRAPVTSPMTALEPLQEPFPESSPL